MITYYEIISTHKGSISSSPVLCSVYGYTKQFEVVQYFTSNQEQFPNLVIMKYEVCDEYEFLNMFLEKHGIPLGDVFEYELAMRYNIMQLKKKPLYVRSDDHDHVVSYQRDIYYTAFEKIIKRIVIYEKFLQDFSLKEEFYQIITLLIEYLQQSKKSGYSDGYDMFDDDSLLIQLIEEEGNYYYGDN